MALSSLASYRSTMPFRKGFTIAKNRKRTYRNTRPLYLARAPQQRCHPFPPDDFTGLLESYANVKEIPDELPGVPKSSESQRQNFIAGYYTNVIKDPPKRY